MIYSQLCQVKATSDPADFVCNWVGSCWDGFEELGNLVILYSCFLEAGIRDLTEFVCSFVDKFRFPALEEVP